MNTVIMTLLSVTIVVATLIAWRFFKQAHDLRSRFAGIIDVSAELVAIRTQVEQLKAQRSRFSDLNSLDTELANVNVQLQQARAAQQQFQDEDSNRRTKLNEEYAQALAKYNELKKEIGSLEDNLEDISFGVYKPHFNFGTPEEYKVALEKLRDKQRQLIRDGEAAVCPVNWCVGNSATEGARMVRLNTKLILRAFNGECEAAVANVSWNNVSKMEERVRKSFAAVNKLGEVLKVSLTDEYLHSKLTELLVTYEYEQKKHRDREDLRRIREEHKEEERALREIEEAREQAEQEETRFQKALEKAREEAAKATGAQLQKLTDQIGSFEAKLDEARQKKERAISRAQLTKSGFVYVISNLGSFGARTYKFGMTRRMEPMDRIYELGGASVPFPFDLHVMLYSDNAPELEYALHHLFEDRRVNLVNARREFYRDIELHEIEAFVQSRGLSAQFIRDVEAREYRETLARIEQRASKKPPAQTEAFSQTLFDKVAAANE